MPDNGKTIWQKVTPVPPEINVGYLFECRKCGQTISYCGREKYPPIECPKCHAILDKPKIGGDLPDANTLSE